MRKYIHQRAIGQETKMLNQKRCNNSQLVAMMSVPVSIIDQGYLIQEINNKQQQQRRIFMTQCKHKLLHKFIYIA